jgi:hypothetical protein
MNSISENINSSDKEKNDGKENIDFLYISDDELIFAFNYNFDDKNEEKKITIINKKRNEINERSII